MVDYTTPLAYTPQDYRHPDQVKSMYDYAKVLLKDAQQPVQHWSQGVSNMVSALVGGDQSYRAGKHQNEADATRAGRLMPDTSGNPPNNPPPVKPTSFSEGTATDGPKTAGGPIDFDRAEKATASIESGGAYDKLGPVTKTGDRAYGKYQVMGKNIPEWSRTHLGREITPDEFLNDSKAQDAIYRGQMGQYAQKYGPEGAARAWFAGEGGMNDPQRKDQLGTTVENYGKRFATAYGPDATQPPAVQAMSAALRGPQVAEVQTASGKPGVAVPANPNKPMPEGGQIYVNPALIPKRPMMNEGQVRGVLSDPTISEAARMGIRQEYIQQNQPIDIPYPGGVVRVNPNNPTQQQFIPELKWGKSKLGDMEKDIGLTYDGKGNVIQAPAVQGRTVGPRSEADPVVAPAVAPAGGPAAPAMPGSAVAANAPAAPVVAPEAVPNTGGVQVASLDPAAGVAAAAAKAASPFPEPDVDPANPLAKWAQATPPGVPQTGNTVTGPAGGGLNLSGFTQQETEDYAKKKAFDVKTAVDEDALKKGADMAMKKYDNMSTQAQSARKLMPNLDLAITMMEDPNFSSGLLHGVKDTWQRFKDATGIEKMSNAPNEAFDKLMAGTVLDTMKSTLAGLGQVRLAEIDLLNRANGNRNNSVASNRAVLEISKRAVQKVDQLDSIAQQYVSGDEVLNPLDGKPMLKANLDRNGEIMPRRGLDAGFDKLARKFTLEHPSFTPDEIKNYHELFAAPKDKGAVGVAPPPPAAATPAVQQAPPAAVDFLKANPASRPLFEKRYGPADKYLQPSVPPVSN